MEIGSQLRRFGAADGGQSVVLVALMFTLLLGFTGAAIDAGRFYAQRRFLQNAVDAGVLACAREVTQGSSASVAQAAGKQTVESYNGGGGPLGVDIVVSATPVYTTWFNSLGPADQRNLADGVVAGAIDCRVATAVTIRTFFLQLFGVGTIPVPANAHAKAKGGMLPIVVNRYQDPPGPSSSFLDYTIQEQYQLDHPNTCSENGGGGCPTATGTLPPSACLAGGCLWGPEAVLIGTGYRSSDSDFRGFIALDIRDFSTVDAGGNPVHQYYNNTAGMNSTQLKDQEASYVEQGYPGPDLIAYDPSANPVQTGLQVATMSGSSAGIVVKDKFTKYVRVGDAILVQLFDGQVREIPDFTINQPTTITANSPSGPANGPVFKVGANQRFRDANDTVDLAMASDTFNAGAGNDTPSGLHTFTFDPDDFVPQGGSGTQVTIKELQVDSGVASGIYSVKIRGTGSTPGDIITSTHEVWVPLNVGGVTRDFSMDWPSTTQEVGLAVPATYTFQLTTGSGGSAWGNNVVTVAADRDTCTSGQAALTPVAGPVQCVTPTISASPNFVPTKNSPPTVTVTIPTTGVPNGTYTLVIRARGTNGAGQNVVHVQQLVLAVGTALGGTTKYVNVQGYTLFVVTWVDSNTVKGRAITGYHANPYDAELDLGRRPGLIPWEADPY